MYELYRCKARVGYKFFASNRMVVFDEDQISSLELKLHYDGAWVDLNSETIFTKLMMYNSEQNTCSVAIKDPYFTSIAWPALLDIAGQQLSSSQYTPGVSAILRECADGEDPKTDKCYKYDIFRYTEFFASGFSQTPADDLFTTADTESMSYTPAMLLISLWYEAPNGYTFGTDYVYMVTNVSISHGSNYPTVQMTGAGNYGVIFQNGIKNIAISDKDNIEKSVAEIIEKLGYEPVFCQANYSEPRKLDRKIALRGVTPADAVKKLVTEYLGGSSGSLPVRDFYKKLHICTRADGQMGRKVFYLGKPLYEAYEVTGNVDKSFLRDNLERFDTGLEPGASGGTTLSPMSVYKLDEISSVDTTFTILKNSSTAPLKNLTFVNNTFTLNKPSVNVVSGTWVDFKSDRSIYATAANKNLFFLNARTPPSSIIEILNDVSPWYSGKWSTDKVYSPIFGEIVNKTGSTILIKSNEISLFFKGNNSGVISKHPIHVEISNINVTTTSAKVEIGEEIGTKTKDNILMRFYILNAGSRVYISIPVAIQFAIGTPRNAPSLTVSQGSGTSISTPTGFTIKNLTKLKELIISGESDQHRNEAANNLSRRGTIRSFVGKPGSELTIAELMNFQQDETKIRAIGWLQIIPKTLILVVNSGGIDPKKKFTEATQDEIFLWILKNKRPEVYNYLVGVNDNLIEAAQALAREWAAIGISRPESPEAQLRASGEKITAAHKRVRNVGESLYAGHNRNKASISPQAVQKVLKETKSLVNPPTADADADKEETPTTLQPGFIWPMSGLIFSLWRSAERPRHAGIDISAPTGTDVIAAASGEIIKVVEKDAGGYGLYLDIRHSNGYTTRYAHLSRILVKKGQIVAQGQLIAKSGNTGFSTGPHLHFEIRNATGKDINPSTVRNRVQVVQNTPIPQNFDSSQVKNYTRIQTRALKNTNGASSITDGDMARAVPAYGLANSGFTLSTEFKGVPRALRILPRFTVLSFLATYQEWLKANKDDSIDPNVWLPEQYFRNWFISTTTFMWNQGDLRVKLEGSSPLAMSASNIVPDWETFSSMLDAQGYRSSYIDYIRAFGDLCWTDGKGYNSCEDFRLAEEVFEQLQGNLSPNGTSGISQGPTANSGAFVAGQCNTTPQSIGISPNEYQNLLKMIIAEVTAEKTILAWAMVSRVILNRWIVNRETKGNNPYGAGANKTLDGVVMARRPNSSLHEFSPLDDKRFYEKRTPEQFARAETAFRLSLNTDYLLKNGVPRPIVQATNFQRGGRGSHWGGPTYKIEHHTFSRSTNTSSFDLIGLWTKYYGNCTTIQAPQTTTTSPPSGASNWNNPKASGGSWKGSQSAPLPTKFVLAAGHQADPQTGADAIITSKLRNYRGGPPIPQTIESAMNRRALDIFVKVGKSKGFNINTFTPESYGSGDAQAFRGKEWDRLVSKYSPKTHYVVELHFDQYKGASGVLAPQTPNMYDEMLGREFGKFPNRVGLNNRGGTIFEIGPTNEYIAKAFLRGEDQGDFSTFDAEVTRVAHRFWDTIAKVKPNG